MYIPVWEGPVCQWATGFVRRNNWRVDRIHGQDDLLQDAWLVFNKLRLMYRVETAGEFLALFKRAIINQFHDRASAVRRRTASGYSGTFDPEMADRIIGEVGHPGYLNALLAEAPDEIKMALGCFDDPVLRTALRLKRRRRGKRRPKPNLNMRLCRLIGLPAGTDIVGQIRAFLT